MALTGGQRAKYWRELQNLTQAELAERASMDPSKLCRIEKGQQPAREDDIAAIAKALGMTMSEFYGGEAAAS